MDQHEDRPDRQARGASGGPPTAPRRPSSQSGLDDPDKTEPVAAPPADETSVRSPDDELPMYPGPPPVDDDDTRVTGSGAGGSAKVPGRLLGERYELSQVIGRGGMAEVRRAYDTRLGRWVAVKELRADLASDDTFQARFRREAQSAAGLNHPNIVAVYDTGDEYDPVSKLRIPFIVMELVEGQTLRDILKEGRKILPERALELTIGVLDALSYSHRAGIIHRDIKPANVMLTPQGNVKVMDFGIARAVSDASSSMTQTAAVIGTAQYLSPEQARGETVDARSDIYSAGCLLYELLIGRPPFVGDSPVSVAYQHVRELPVPPSKLNELITPDIDAIVLTALAKDPADRYQTARAMTEDIRRLLAGEEVTASTPASASSATEPTTPVATVVTTEEVVEPEDEQPRRSRALPVVITLLALVLVALLGAGALWWSRPTQPEPTPQVAVPTVLGQQQAAAETAIRTARLVPEVSQVEGPGDSTVGTVIRQNPPAGTMVDPGRTVRIEVNTGPRQATIPTGLAGQSANRAKDLLSAAGFNNVQTVDAQQEPPEAHRNTVLDVRPAEGTTVTVDTQITLEVATGVSPVPNWVGWNQASVEQDRQNRGFTDVVFETRETQNPAEVDTVVATSPTAGSQIQRTDRITVYIGRPAPAPSPTPVPTPPTPTPGSPTPSPMPTSTPQ